MNTVDETFDCQSLSLIKGGARIYVSDGIAGYLGIRFNMNGAREKAMQQYPEAFCRLMHAVEDEAKRLKAEGVPPFDESPDEEKGSNGGECKVKVLVKNGRYYRAFIKKMTWEDAERLIRQMKSKR